MWANYHCHTRYCDGKNTVKEVARAANKHNLVSLGISSHAPLPFQKSWCMKADQLYRYIEDIRAAAKHTATQLYAGLEVDYIPNVISPAQFKPQLDYTIGSIHFVESFPEGTHWEIDSTLWHFQEGLVRIFNRDARAAVSRYLELTRKMVAETQPDIVGHLDKIKIHNLHTHFFDESETWYREQIYATLDAIAAAGVMIEINTRGIYQQKWPTTYPSPWMWPEIRKRNIPITLNSDAHHHRDLTNQFSRVAKQLHQAGFNTLRVLYHAAWVDVPFNEHGLDEQFIKKSG